jgi:hypothetical protein
MPVRSNPFLAGLILAFSLFSLPGCGDQDFKTNFVYHCLLGKTVYFDPFGTTYPPSVHTTVNNLSPYRMRVLSVERSPLKNGNVLHQATVSFRVKVAQHDALEVRGLLLLVETGGHPWRVDFRGYEQLDSERIGPWRAALRGR